MNITVKFAAVGVLLLSTCSIQAPDPRSPSRTSSRIQKPYRSPVSLDRAVSHRTGERVRPEGHKGSPRASSTSFDAGTPRSSHTSEGLSPRDGDEFDDKSPRDHADTTHSESRRAEPTRKRRKEDVVVDDADISASSSSTRESSGSDKKRNGREQRARKRARERLAIAEGDAAAAKAFKGARKQISGQDKKRAPADKESETRAGDHAGGSASGAARKLVAPPKYDPQERVTIGGKEMSAEEAATQWFTSNDTIVRRANNETEVSLGSIRAMRSPPYAPDTVVMVGGNPVTMGDATKAGFDPGTVVRVGNTSMTLRQLDQKLKDTQASPGRIRRAFKKVTPQSWGGAAKFTAAAGGLAALGMAAATMVDQKKADDLNADQNTDINQLAGAFTTPVTLTKTLP